MKISLMIAIILIFSECQSIQENPKGTNTLFCVNIELYKKEYLDIDSLKINGVIPLKSSRDVIDGFYGKPEFIYTNTSSSQIVNYGKTIFETIGNEMFLKELDMEQKGIQLIHPRITIDIHTNLNELGKIFPESVKLGNLTCGNGCWGTIIIKATSSGNQYWLFKYRADILSKIIFFS